MNDNLFLLAPENSDDRKDPLPPSDTEYPIGSIIRRNQLLPIRFALALGLVWGILFVVIALIITLTNGNTLVLDVFNTLYPGFIAGDHSALLAGFIWSFLYGVISGLFIAMIYNALARIYVLSGGDGYETYG